MYYIAYGSNMNNEQMKYRCPNSKSIGTGTILNYELVFAYHADIRKKKNATTPCVVWDIAEEDWEYLDIYEGYPKYYTTAVVEYIDERGEKHEGIAYVMSDLNELALPSEHYYRCILAGYRDYKIDDKPLKTALEKACMYVKKTNLE